MGIQDLLKSLGMNSGRSDFETSVPEIQEPESYASKMEKLNLVANQLPDDSNVPMGEVAGRFGLPGENLSTIPDQERPDYLADQLKQTQQPSTLKSKESVISSLKQSLASRSPAVNEEAIPAPVAMDPIVAPKPAMSNYESELNSVLQDRKNNMHGAVRRAAANDISNYMLMAMGNENRLNSTSNAEVKRMEDLGLKDFNEKTALSGKVLGAEKAKIDLVDLQDMNDPNSLLANSIRSQLVKYLGISPEQAANMNTSQLKEYGALVRGLVDSEENRDFKKQELQMRKEENALDREVKRESIEASKAIRLEKTNNKPSAFRETRLKKLGESAAEYDAKDRGTLIANSEKVGDAIELINKNKGFWDSPSGPIKGMLPDAVRNLTNPAAVAIKRDITSAIIDTLRPILGAQFTENEGKRIMGLAYDDKVPYAETKRRASELKKIIDTKIEATDALYNHLENGGDLKDFNFGKYGMKARSGGSSTTPSSNSSSYSPAQESGISNVMSKNSISREEAISALNKAGKL